MIWHTRFVALTALVALLLPALFACGGDDDDDTDSLPASNGQSDDGADDDGGDGGDGDDDGADDDDNGDDDGFDFGEGTAVVTVGDTRYEFDLTSGFVVCRDVFGGMQVAGPSADSEDVTIDAWIPPTNWETFDDGRYDPPSLSISDDANNTRWVADPGRTELFENFPEESKVDSYEKDGLAASGTATFIDEYALLRGETPEPVQGTFEIACEE